MRKGGVLKQVDSCSANLTSTAIQRFAGWLSSAIGKWELTVASKYIVS